MASKSSYTVKRGNVFGRVAQGFAQGFGPQIQKEMERNRLQQGLEDVSQNSEGLSPFQKFAKLSGVYGITPQQVESGSRLLEREAQRNAYRNPRSGEQLPPSEPNASPTPRQDIAFSPTSAGVGMSKQEQPKGRIPEGFSNREDQAKSGAQIVPENPTNAKFVPAIPWTQEKREAEASKFMDRDPALSLGEAFNMANEKESRELARPRAEQERQEYLQAKQDEAEAELDKQLETALQKEGKNIYGDLTGDTLLDLKKSMANDLATNPDLTVKQAAEKWRRNAKDFVEVKNIMREKAERPFLDKISPQGKEDTLKSLKIAQKSYETMGKSREFYNTLISDFGLSPGAAALIAYPRSPELKATLKNGWGNTPMNEAGTKSRQYAKDFLDKGTSKDSALAYAKSLKNKFPFFDQRAFNDYLEENLGRLSPDQKKNFNKAQSIRLATGATSHCFLILGGP